MHCPLCYCHSLNLFYRDRRRDYCLCSACGFIFVPRAFHLSASAERAVYDHHENNPEDAGYRRFLSRLATPLLERLPAGSKGLDFGCGPGPALAKMLIEHGHSVALFDKFYACDNSVWSQNYDFICATEVLEHLARPRFEVERLWQQLKPGGYLGIMTKLAIDKTAFARWHYKNDPSHIGFFSERSVAWLSAYLGARLERVATDAFVFVKEVQQ